MIDIHDTFNSVPVISMPLLLSVNDEVRKKAAPTTTEMMTAMIADIIGSPTSPLSSFRTCQALRARLFDVCQRLSFGCVEFEFM